MSHKYHIVYDSDFQEIAQDGSNEFDSEKEALCSLEALDRGDLTVIKCDDEGCIYSQEGHGWVKIS